MLAAQDREAVYTLLIQEQPKLHGRPTRDSYEPAACNWSLLPSVLSWISHHIGPGCRTLETGCGYSTVVFAIWGCHHLVVSPFAQEHASVNDWCRAHGVSTGSITYHAGPSQRVLPAMDPTPLDLVLIDGDHAVPAPYIDYYYTADRLVQGGVMLVDDTQLRSVRQLCEFLDEESQRWEVVEQLERTRIYRKLVEGKVAEGIRHLQQPFISNALKPGLVSRVARKIRRASFGLIRGRPVRAPL